MNLLAETLKIQKDGYSQANAEAKLCQDIIVKAISNSTLNRNITIKGGVVMRSLSDNVRRATQDLDIDFIKYSISDNSIAKFVRELNCVDGVNINVAGKIEELKHQDYKGKRIHIKVSDNEGNSITMKLDIGVHKDLDIEQEEYCYDICFDDDSASVLINSKEQMITEKLKSLLRFGTRSTRYKDVFDICYLSDYVDYEKLYKCVKKYIYDDISLEVNDSEDIIKRIKKVFSNERYKNQVERSKKNWLEISIDDVFKKNIHFFENVFSN